MNSLNQFQWGPAVQTYLIVLLGAGIVAMLVGGLIAARARGGLVDGFLAAVHAIRDFFGDLSAFSFRRLWAITWHSIIESIRRRMLLAVFGVLAVVFMFGGWFLESRPTEQVKVYVSFVLLSSTLIVIPAGALLACLSLPSDIRDKTIHTVVTKPVRRLEIVVGRIVGLTVIATAILAAMGAASYVYMTRSVAGSLAEIEQKIADAKARGDVKNERELAENSNQIRSRLTARIPIYGMLGFSGEPKNVGYETMTRLYVEGNSVDAAVWQFKELPVDRLLAMKKIPLEISFSVFRTTKGEVGKGVIAQISYANLKTGRQITDYPFEVLEYYTDQQTLDDRADPGRTYFEANQALAEPPGNPLAWLLDGSGGELAIAVRCLSSSQYLGVSQPDLYVLLDRASFALNFAKGILGVWLRVFLIICVAVMFSTILSSYVAMLATAATFAGGSCMNYLTELARGKQHGGGSFEAGIRMVTHENLERPLELGVWGDIIQGIDGVLQFVFRIMAHLLPDLGFFNTAPLVANGFDIGGAVLFANVVVAFAYALPITILAYFLLYSREIAR